MFLSYLKPWKHGFMDGMVVHSDHGCVYRAWPEHGCVHTTWLSTVGKKNESVAITAMILCQISGQPRHFDQACSVYRLKIKLMGTCVSIPCHPWKSWCVFGDQYLKKMTLKVAEIREAFCGKKMLLGKVSGSTHVKTKSRAHTHTHIRVIWPYLLRHTHNHTLSRKYKSFDHVYIYIYIYIYISCLKSSRTVEAESCSTCESSSVSSLILTYGVVSSQLKLEACAYTHRVSDMMNEKFYNAIIISMDVCMCVCIYIYIYMTYQWIHVCIYTRSVL